MTHRILDYVPLTAVIPATILLIHFCRRRISEFAILSGYDCTARVSRFELYINFERVQHYERYLIYRNISIFAKFTVHRAKKGDKNTDK